MIVTQYTHPYPANSNNFSSERLPTLPVQLHSNCIHIPQNAIFFSINFTPLNTDTVLSEFSNTVRSKLLSFSLTRSIAYQFQGMGKSPYYALGSKRLE